MMKSSLTSEFFLTPPFKAWFKILKYLNKRLYITKVFLTAIFTVYFHPRSKVSEFAMFLATPQIMKIMNA